MAHYGTRDLPVLNKRPSTKEICIRTANGATMKAMHEAELDILALHIAARHIYIVPDLADKTLLSVSQLCKADCQVVFNDKTITVHHHGKIVLKGGLQNGLALWEMEIPNKPECTLEFTANAAIYFNTAAKIVKFMHAALGYPTLATLDKALAMGLVKGFPGLTQHTLRSHPPFSDATVKGHMAQTRSNVRSTKTPQQKREGEAKLPNSQNVKKPNQAQRELSQSLTRQEAQVGRASSKCNQTPSAQREKPPVSLNEQNKRAYSKGQSQQGDEEQHGPHRRPAR
jgi:hypothetical protein